MTTEKRAVKYGKQVKTDFIKIGDPDSQEAKDSEFEFRRSVNGLLLEKDRMNMSSGLVGRYKIEQGEGESDPVTFLGSTILDDLLSLIEVGDDIYVGFTGVKKSTTTGHSPTKQYEVFKAE